MGARARPQGGAFAQVPFVRAAELASLRQSSPPNRFRDRGAAAPAGALSWRHGMAHLQLPKTKGKAALDAATTTENTRMTLEPGSSRG